MGGSSRSTNIPPWREAGSRTERGADGPATALGLGPVVPGRGALANMQGEGCPERLNPQSVLVGGGATEFNMASDREIEEKFWSELKSSPFIMLGLDNARDGATQPMTANFEDRDQEGGILWFFSANDHDFAKALSQSDQAIGAFSAKGHDLFASLRGRISIQNDRETIDRLWNPVVAQWYEGKDDPKLALLRFDVDDIKIWLSDVEGFLKPAFNKLLGRKSESGMGEKVAEVSL